VDLDVTLELSTRAPSQVRRSLAERYANSMETSLLDDLTLLTSEIVTNAVQHSRRPHGDDIHVSADVSEGVLRVEVTDHGEGLDPLEPRSLKPPSGLGYLHFLSDRWSSRRDDSFHVWFEIDVVTRSVLYRAPA
jgi:anti-sigma regulatory factor (Ser/Thr protein kinase)